MSSICRTINNCCSRMPALLLKGAEYAIFGVGIATTAPLAIIPSIFISLAAIPLNLITQPIIFMEKRKITNRIKFINDNYTQCMKEIVGNHLLEKDGGWDAKSTYEKIELVRAFSLFTLLASNEQDKINLQMRSRDWVVGIVPILNVIAVFQHYVLGTYYKDSFTNSPSSIAEVHNQEPRERIYEAYHFFLSDKKLSFLDVEAENGVNALNSLNDMRKRFSEHLPLDERTTEWIFNNKNTQTKKGQAMA